LHWLKANNTKYYGEIDIRPERIEQLPYDDVPAEVMGIVCQSDDPIIADQADGYVPQGVGDSGMVYVLLRC
jgi:hypothetical protein